MQHLILRLWQKRTSMNTRRYENAAQQRILATMLALARSSKDGVAVGALAKLVNTIPSNATRDLANLRMAGLACDVHGLWFLTPLLWDELAASATVPSKRHPGRICQADGDKQ